MKKNLIFLFAAVLLFAANTYARDLVSSASSLKSTLVAIGGAISGVGIIAGGICYAFGAAELGKRLLWGGIIGAAIIAGYAGIESLIKSVAA